MKNLFIKNGNLIKYIDSDDIYFFTKLNNQTYAYTKKGIIEIEASLNLLSEIIGDNFLRTHKSYLVNINKIDSVYKCTERTYNIRFVDIDEQAFITKDKIKQLISNGYVL